MGSRIESQLLDCDSLNFTSKSTGLENTYYHCEFGLSFMEWTDYFSKRILTNNSLLCVL